MPSLIVRELSELVVELPELRPLTSQLLKEKPAPDLFLCALGFEPRCLTIPELVAKNGLALASASCITYETNVEDNDKNRAGLWSALRGVSRSDVRELPEEASTFAARLKNAIPTVPGSRPSVWFDISVVANRSLLLAMKVLLDLDVNLTILYSEAMIYRPTKEEYEAHPETWRSLDALGLERGVGDVFISPDHPGLHLDPLPDL